MALWCLSRGRTRIKTNRSVKLKRTLTHYPPTIGPRYIHLPLLIAEVEAKHQTIETPTYLPACSFAPRAQSPDTMDPAGLLPGDVLADVLRRLMPRSLAACRSVCKAWCAVVDAHGLLRKDLLPLALAGIFAVYRFVVGYHLPPAFLSRPSVAGKIQGNLTYLDDVHDDWSHIMGHCNGLLLLWGGVANPATRQWAPLPLLPCACSWPPAMCGRCRNNRYLVYDPTVSPHHEVFFIPPVPADEPAATESPPSL